MQQGPRVRAPESDLKEKIESRSAVISIIGLGYIGLPLATIFAEAGFPVLGIDLDRSRIEAICRGESYINDVPSEALNRLVATKIEALTDASETRRFWATDDYEELKHADVVIVCVPTPLSKTRDPDVSYIISAAEKMGSFIRNGALVVLESTTYPGTTEEIILPVLEKSSSLSSDGQPATVGKDFFLAFSPERIDPGRTDWTIKETPKVIGGITEYCLEVAVALYASVVDRVVPVSSPKVAEMVKLLENTFRATNIALVNEVAIICDRLGVDVWEVIEAAKTKPFGFMPFYPGPGLGGHCIPVDPQYLAWKLRTLNYKARFIQLAEEINFSMPEYVLDKIANALNDCSMPLRGSQVLVLGVAYKADMGDLRESPALDVIELLSGKGASVVYNDPYVPSLTVGDISLRSVELNEDRLKSMDCVVITTSHGSYDWGWIVRHSKLIVDTRNATAGLAAEHGGRIVKL